MLPLLALPDDLLLLIASNDTGVACCLRETHPLLACLLAEGCKRAKLDRQYSWASPSGMVVFVKRVLVCVSNNAWATCLPLPSVGKHVFRVAIEQSIHGGMCIGVSDNESLHGWGLNPCYGEVSRAVARVLLLYFSPRASRQSWLPHATLAVGWTQYSTHKSTTHIATCTQHIAIGQSTRTACATLTPTYSDITRGLTRTPTQLWRAQWSPRRCPYPVGAPGRVEYAVRRDPPPPAGFPDGNDRRIVQGLRETHCSAVGTIVEVTYDADARTLSFAMTTGGTGGRRHQAGSTSLSGFPYGARLSPWVHLANSNDRVVIEGKL